jgi:hypothetical protein
MTGNQALAKRLIRRTKKKERKPLKIAGSAVTLREFKTRPRWPTIECAPNSPLLIRVVSNPYAEEVTYARRKQVFKPIGQVNRRPDASEPLMRIAGNERRIQFSKNPFKATPLGPQPRAKANADSWLSQTEGR